MAEALAAWLQCACAMQRECDRRRWKFFAWNGQAMAGMLLGTLMFACPVHAQSKAGDDEGVRAELSAMGKRGGEIAKARELVLEILRTGNSCTQWFEEASPEPAGVFGSLHYAVEEKGFPYVYTMTDGNGDRLYKHPWAASTPQDGGRNSLIRLNPNGPFFSGNSRLMYLNSGGYFVRPGEVYRLVVGSYPGNTAEAQIATLLHELGHILGRLPEDDDSWNGRSSQNSQEMLRHCKREIGAAVRESFARR